MQCPSTVLKMFIVVGLVAISACSDTSRETAKPLPNRVSLDGNRGFVVLPVPSSSQPERYISANVRAFQNDGPYSGYPVQAILNVRGTASYTRHAVLVAPVQLATAQGFADNFGPNMEPALALSMGRQVLGQTVCQDRKIVPNSYGRQFDVTTGAEGSSIPQVRQRGSSWTVDLWCQ